MQKSLQEHCIQSGTTYLLDQWDRDKNMALSPADISYGSKKRVWWRCEKNHEWQARVCDRVVGNSCPVCANRVIQAGENDLGTTHPEIAAQWHPEKNDGLTPADVFAGSLKKVWWQCDLGHEWQARISSRAANPGAGCPVCAGKLVVPGINDLKTMYPEVAGQWHTEKNGDFTPDKISSYSDRQFWWVCEKGHEWKTKVKVRTSSGAGCPYCTGRMVLPGFNDLETVNPQIAAQWHSTLNKDLTPQMVTGGSRKKVWWECADGHVWKAVIYSRTGPRNHGCPVCAGKVKEDWQHRYSETETAGQKINDF